MKRDLYIVDAFTDRRFDGNQAGVVTEGDGLSEKQMQMIAREVNASETAFVLAASDADFELRFFTPSCEVPFCGHAFVAALHLLHELKKIELGGDFARVAVKTGVGLIDAGIVRDGAELRIEMVQAAPAFRAVNHPGDVIASALGIGIEAIDDKLPMELSYTGLWTLIVPIAGTTSLLEITPDFRLLSELNTELGAVVTMAYAREGKGFRTRGFAPVAGVDEDPVTGSASGSLGAYLLRQGQLDPAVPLTLHQRGRSGRGGLVRVVAHGTPERPERITVSGTAVITVRGEVELDDE